MANLAFLLKSSGSTFVSYVLFNLVSVTEPLYYILASGSLSLAVRLGKVHHSRFKIIKHLDSESSASDSEGCSRDYHSNVAVNVSKYPYQTLLELLVIPLSLRTYPLQ